MELMSRAKCENNIREGAGAGGHAAVISLALQPPNTAQIPWHGFVLFWKQCSKTKRVKKSALTGCETGQ